MKQSYIDLMRPKKSYQTILIQREIDGKSFYEKYRKQFVDINCPACGGKGEVIFSKYGFKHKICSYCHTLFCSPRPQDDLLTIYYNDWESPKMWTNLLLDTDNERKMLQYQPRIEKIVSLIKQDHKEYGGIALDVGAGAGAFALCLKRSKFFSDVITLDLSEDCVSTCKKLGLNALKKSINEMANDAVDLISINDLIEHLYDPYVFLTECYRSLRYGGYIAIATPNGEGFDFKVMKDKTVNITPPEHLNYFNSYSIELLLERAGFTVLFLDTPGKLDVQIVLNQKKAGHSIVRNNEYIDFLLTQDEEILNNFQAFISINKLSSHMFCLAKKNQKGPV